MRTRIGLLVQPEPMRSIIDATQRQKYLGAAWNWWLNRDGVPAAPQSQINPTPSLRSAFSGPEWP
jgi:hypothetical protein